MASHQSTSYASAAIWYAVAVLACISVALINGGALYYFDTAGYLAQGKTALMSLGLLSSDAVAGTGGAGAAAPNDGVVVGSRSAIYSALIAGARFTTGLNWIVALHTIALILAVWIPARIAVRRFGPDRSTAQVTATPILVASVGSLPFYTGFLMPDIFAPILLLMAGTFAAFSRDMTKLEIILALALGMIAVVVHPSHLLIAILMVPVVAFASLALARPRWWLGPLLMILIAGTGMVERLIFTSAVKTIQSADVVYQPFLTVRTIQDGPGYALLEDVCPEEGLATCALYDALQVSDDPMRLTVSHIMFETSRDLGSYRLLPAKDQKAVADEQVAFFLRVFAEKPVASMAAFARNTLAQANRYSIEYTIPTEPILTRVRGMTDAAPAWFGDIRFLDARAMFAGPTIIHGIIYAISALLVIVIVVLPQQAPPLTMRAFAMVVFVGVLVNAFVCGAISQPADRYGARVAFLLPMAASFLILFYSGARKKT